MKYLTNLIRTFFIMRIFLNHYTFCRYKNKYLYLHIFILKTLLFVEDKVSIEIRQMSNKKYVPLYLKLLESGSEKKRDIRLVIVGKKGTGKTSLLKRLFREEINYRELTSTNGIEIHRIRCKANYDDGHMV